LDRRAAAALWLVLPGVAVAAPDLSSVGPYSVVAEQAVTFDASSVPLSADCATSQFFLAGAPHDGTEFTWDLDRDGVYEVGWSLTPTASYSAAGIDGPVDLSVPFGGRCYKKNWWDLLGPWVYDEGFGEVKVSVANAPPSVTAPVAVGYGLGVPRLTPISFTTTASDPEAADTLTVLWRWTDGTVQSGTSVTRTFTALGTVTAVVEVRDDDGGIDSAETTFTVGNDPPVLLGFTVPASGQEGVSLTLTASASDPVDPLTYTWLISDGVSLPSTELTGASVAWTPPDQGDYTAEVVISDGLQSIRVSSTISVQNVPPEIYALNAPTRLFEGTPALFEVVAGDVPADPLRATWDTGGGPGSPGALTLSHSFPDDGSYTVDVVVDDGDGGSDSASVAVQVENVAPAPLSIVVPGSGQEGEPLRLYALATDVPADTITYTWLVDGVPYDGGEVFVSLAQGYHLVFLTISDGEDDWVGRFDVSISNQPPVLGELSLPRVVREGEEVELSVTASDPGGQPVLALWTFGDGAQATGETVLHTWADDGVYAGTVQLSDGQGGVTSVPFSIEVDNLPPELGAIVAPDVDEGSLVVVQVSVSDPGSETPTITWWVAGVQVGSGPTWTTTPPDDATITVTAKADDGDGGRDEATATFAVLNVPPSPLIIGDTDDSGGAVLSWTALVDDPGADTFQFDWDFGDGAVLLDGGPSAIHSYAVNGSYDVVVTVTDDDGGVGQDILVVQIGDIGPSITDVTVPDVVDEGAQTALSCAAVDLGGAGGLTYTWDFGDGTTGVGATPTHAWADDGGWYVRCAVTDALGRQDRDGATVEVRNVAPLLVGTPPSAVVEGDTLSWTPTVVDPGADTFLFEIGGPAGVAVSPAGAVSWPTARGSVGSYQLTLTVRDDDGGMDRRVWTVAVSLRDLDGDGMGDFWEDDYGLDPSDPADAALDPDGDGRDSLTEYELGTDPTADDRPTAPELLYPVRGEEVATVTPSLEVGPAYSPPDDALLYQVEVYRDAGLTSAVGVWTAPGSRTGVVIQSSTLDENKRYWWTARARDTFAPGPWAAAEEFFVNAVEEAPSAPTLQWPSDQSTVGTQTPGLTWQPAEDPEGQPLTYTLFAEDASSGAVARIPGLTGPGPITWTATPALPDGTSVTWWVVAVDPHGLESPASDAWQFVVDLGNQPPSEPLIVTPVDGGVVASSMPVVEVVNGVDPEGRSTWLRWELTLEGVGVEQLGEEPADPAGVTRWTVDGLAEDAWYVLSVLSTDGAAESAWVTSRFLVNETNNPPSVPELVAPGSGTLREDDPLEWRPSTDPEGQGVTYDVVVTDAGGVVRAQAVALEAVGPRVTWTPPTLSPGVWTWKVRAVDEAGAASAWTEPWSFVQPAEDVENSRQVPDPLGAVDLLVGCGCASAGGSSDPLGKVGGGWVVGLLLAAALRRRTGSAGRGEAR
jgi:MYXO-CTERM domain-containing protein